MSDLPNFSKKPWFHRLGLLRILLAAAVALLTAIAWGDTPGFPNDVDLSLQINNPSSHVLIGHPMSYSIVVKNNGDQTVRITDMQIGVYMTSGSCVQPGQSQKKSFSLPHNIAVEPNSSQSVSGNMEILTPCDGKAVCEIFSVMQRDTQRISIKRPGPSFDLL